MTKKINDVTSLFVDGEEDAKSKFYAGERAANLAIDNGCYEQAWDHYYNLYMSNDYKSANDKRYFKGRATHGLCKVMQETPDDDPFIKKLIETDPDLIRKSRTKTITNSYARKFIGRKYLLVSADQFEYLPAIEEYALNCVGKGPKKSFVFEYNDRDAQIGLQWANKLMDSRNDDMFKTKGYIVYAIYHFARYRATKDINEGKQFCEYVMKAKHLKVPGDEYAWYFYAHICCDPKYKFFQDGAHYNPRNGYEILKSVLKYAEDPDIIASANNIIKTLETKYPSMIR